MDASPTMPKSKAEHVAQRLLDKIITAGLAPGSSFGTEAELLTQFDVSRPTLRESLRILESQGVLELRPGPRGGIMVRKPSTDILAHGLSVYLRLHDVPFIAVLKAREVIEPALASEAAINGTEEDFDELEASIRRMKAIDKDQTAFIEENRIFHSIIARASGNKVLETFWQTISILATGEHHGVRYSFGNQQHVIEAHQGILDACRARDNKVAAAKMEAHVTELEHLVRKRYQNLLTQPTSVVGRQGRRIA
ncbi:GntR family transcriptional regulator [Hyphomicrobiales bacterium]|nr:GntR family transcriptional regulator [Hyphomicrobiales bacterium]CAH1690618.1 GntR family transcriptional regulator [Hyphomicrobiales bacterium]